MSTVLLKIYVRDRAICKWGRVSQACPTRCLPGDTGVLTAVALQESGVFEKTRCVSGVGTDETAVSLKGVGSPGLCVPPALCLCDRTGRCTGRLSGLGGVLGERTFYTFIFRPTDSDDVMSQNKLFAGSARLTLT